MRVLRGLVVILCWAGAAQAEPLAIDRFEPAERGSTWFANESPFRSEVGVVGSFARRPSQAPIDDLLLLHLGGAYVLRDRVRLAGNFPISDRGIGDLRVAVDAHVYGPLSFGAALWAPTGEQSKWLSDGDWRVRPRLMVADTIRGHFAYAAQAWYSYRAPLDSEVGFAAAVGASWTRFTIGPEVFGAYGERSSHLEALVGMHALISELRVGVAGGRGFGQGLGDPDVRGLVSVEWVPSQSRPVPMPLRLPQPRPTPKLDRDHDGVTDDIDACLDVPGIHTNDPLTNGCPPDSDGDGINDLEDACPSSPGPRTEDSKTTGCNLDRDKDGVPNELDACPDEAGPINGCPIAHVKGSEIKLLRPITFKTAKAELDPDSNVVLDEVRKVLATPEIKKLRVEVHTDIRGNADANKKLSADRAAAVIRWLVEHGVDGTRLAPEGVGGDRPIDTNDTENGRTNNRRVELHILEQ